MDITQPRPKDLPEVTQQAALMLSTASVPVPSVSAPTHSTSAPLAQGTGGGKQHGVCACVCIRAGTPAHAALFQVSSSSGDTRLSLFLSPNNNPSASHSPQGMHSHHLEPPSTLFPLTPHPGPVQGYRSSPRHNWLVKVSSNGYWVIGVASKTLSHS